MTTTTISAVASQTGLSPSTLRYYDEIGLVRPDRAANGYRSYSERALDALHLVARAKQLGLSLDEIAGILAVFEDEDCGPVQDRLRHLVERRITDSQDELAKLFQTTADLQRIAAALDHEPAEGSCGPECGCMTDSETRPAGSDTPTRAVTLLPSIDDNLHCSLDTNDISTGALMADWRRVTDGAIRRTAIDGGLRLHFRREVDVAELAVLSAAEQTCCSFLRFSITVAPEEITLDVMAPADAVPMLESIFGVASEA